MTLEPLPETPSQEVKARLEAMLFGQSARDFTWWKIDTTRSQPELKDMLFEEVILPKFLRDMSELDKPLPCKRRRVKLTYLQLEVEKFTWHYWVGDLPEERRVYWARCV